MPRNKKAGHRALEQLRTRKADEDARELLKACRNAVALLDHIGQQRGQVFPETSALAIATEAAEPAHDGKRITGREFVFTSPTVGPLLLKVAREALARLQKIQADEIALTEEFDALPYPEADSLDLALSPFEEVRPAPVKGPLESLKLKDHCEMCGAHDRPGSKAHLEPAFDPSGNPKTLCRDCRIGSAELREDALTDAARNALDVFEYTLSDCADDDRQRMQPAADRLRAALTNKEHGQ